MKTVQLHLACGPNVIDGWDNLDILEDPGIIVHDLRQPLPYKDKSVSKIFHEHFIEHLPKAEGYIFLQECYRVLKPGAAMKVGWPDLAKLIKAYNTRDKGYQDYVLPFLEDRHLGSDWDEIFSDCLFSWEHLYAYTSNHLKKLLAEVGFREIVEVAFRESKYDIRIEVRDDPATTYIEAVR